MTGGTGSPRAAVTDPAERLDSRLVSVGQGNGRYRWVVRIDVCTRRQAGASRWEMGALAAARRNREIRG
jgi:hypothetical protein